MTETAEPASLVFPFPTPPERGEAIEIAPGLLWARIPLPFRLDHVNVYFIDDGDGWAVVDTGIDDDKARLAWNALLAGPLAGPAPERGHRHPYAPRSYRACRLADGKFDIPLMTARPPISNASTSVSRRAACSAGLSQFLSAQRPR